MYITDDDLLRRAKADPTQALIFRYKDGTALFENNRVITWFDRFGKLSFCTSLLKALEKFSDCNIVHFIRVNDWLKLYFSNDKSIRILVNNKNISTPPGTCFCEQEDKFYEIYRKVTVNLHLFNCGDTEFSFENNVADFRYYNEGFIVLLSTENQFNREDGLYLYSVDFDGNIRWRLHDGSIYRIPPDYFGMLSGYIFGLRICDNTAYLNLLNTSVEIGIDCKRGRFLPKENRNEQQLSHNAR